MQSQLKEFQTHKHEVTTGQDSSEAQAQQPIFFNAYDPPANQESSFQQQQIPAFAVNSNPLISSYFDTVNGQSFNIPQQQFSNLQELSPIDASFAPAQQQEDPRHFQTPVAFAQIVQPEEFQRTADIQLGRSVELQQQLEQQSHQITQLRSELEFHRNTATNLQKNIDELNKLKTEESHSSRQHADVVKVLVSEKSSLIDALQKAELAVKSKFEENEELQNRLNASRHRVKHLESEVRSSSGRPIVEEDTNKIEEIVAARIKDFKDSNHQIESEKNELKVLLSQKRIELENLQKNFDHLNTELHLANVKIAQLSDESAPTIDNSNQSHLNAINQELAIKQQQIAELYSVIDQVNRDKEASDCQYQNYVSHLIKEMESLKENTAELSNENDALVKREQNLLKHVADLERQMQQQIQRQKTYADNQKETTPNTSSEELQQLTSQIAALTESNESLKANLRKIEIERNEINQNLLVKIEDMKDLEMKLEQLKTNSPNLSQLMTDFEDKSVAASRALSQNQGLKEQLDEMQKAFITMTNDKMELTSKLQSEMHLCKEMKILHDSMEKELQEMKDKWHYKEDEMIRLSHENTELGKKIFQQNIEVDRLRHYESKEYHGTEGILQKELENCKRLIETLSNKINILESDRSHEQHDVEENKHTGHSHSHDGHGHSHSHDDHSHDNLTPNHSCNTDDSKKHLLEEIEMLKMEKNELLKAINDFQMNKKSENLTEETLSNGQSVHSPRTNEAVFQKPSISKSITPSMATEEALEKLQSRFRRTMLEVAELTDEKQRLEHVVTQLQFETETIGEYITLYQYQRRLLKQKEHERDIQLKNLAADREKMNDKLIQLNSLIEKFVLQHSDNVELAKEASKFLNNEHSSDPLIVSNENLHKLKKETAGKILEILSDIKTANSIYDANIGVEHCSCCLGKLETV